MSRKERAVIYTALAILAGLNLSWLMSRGGQVAHAAPAGYDTLGPADSLTLSGDEDLVLRNADGRLSWGGASHDRAHSIAFVHIGQVLTPLMETETFAEQREVLLEELQEAEQEYQSRLDGLRARVEGLDPQSPQAQEAIAEGNRVLGEYQQWRAEAQRRTGQLQAQQMEEAYNELVSAVEVVAEREGIDIVLRYIPPDAPFENLSPEGALTTIRLRTALRRPEGLDITPEIIEELSLEVDDS